MSAGRVFLTGAGGFIGHALAERFRAEGWEVGGVDLAADAEQVFVIGGEQIYRLALALADRIELTEIDTSVDGDAWFPEIDRDKWDEQQRETHSDPASGLRYDYVTLERVGR